MKKYFLFLALATFAIFSKGLNSQDNKTQGEHYFKFMISSRNEISTLTKIISIDNVQGNEVTAFANPSEFEKFKVLGYTYTELPLPGSDLTEADINGPVNTETGRTTWNFYPNYQQYLDYMAGFAASYPEICKLDTIGVTTQGRLILAVKISDSVQLKQGEPEVLMTSSIHGDELTGYVCMMHLIDTLLSSYNVSNRLTNMINNYQIYINPMANPDGTFHGGNTSVSGAWRYNANSIDLNRNFADPDDGPHPDGNPWQIETKAFMRFDTIHHLVLSMNFHGGAEVFNYPWDTWAKLHADDSWCQFVGREYADTVHAYGPSGYFDDEINGITNGYAWYEVQGGRQDYTTYFHHGREVTLELSNTKLPPANQLLNFWKYQKRSFLNYIDEVYYGINGQVIDSLTGEPLKAKVNIWGHDFDNSFVFSDSLTGWYYRLIDQGTYNLTFTCSGYRSKSVTADVARRQTTRKNVQLVPLTYGIGEHLEELLTVYPNPSKGLITISYPPAKTQDATLKIFSSTGNLVREIFFGKGNSDIRIDLQSIAAGVYILEMQSGNNISYAREVIVR